MNTTSVELHRQIDSVQWFHRIDLGNGIITPGIDHTQKKLRTLHLPDLKGKTVLDVGAWDGFFSFEAERRGASRVLATDSYIWKGEGWASKRGFDVAKQALNSKVEEMIIDPMELSPERVGMWDVVLYSGILYHMRQPLAALERIASVTRELVIVETMLDRMFTRRPAIAFYQKGCYGDPTNHCGPNHAALLSILRSVGFARIKRVYNRMLPVRIAHAAYWTLRGHNPLADIQRGRATYHAWKLP